MQQRETWGMNANRYEWLMHSMELYRKAAAIVSEELMVLYHTETCEAVLDRGGFYSVQDWLSPAVCSAIHTCIQSGETQTVSADLGHMRCMIQMIPLEREALLIFEGAQERFPALLLDALRMRQRADSLLRSAETLSRVEGAEETARQIRNTALQLLRQAQHAELLGSDGVPSVPRSCDVGELLRDTMNILRRHGYQVNVWTESGLYVTADPALLQAALVTMVVNSIQAGGPAVKVVFKASRREDFVVIRVEDDGPGMPQQAIERMRDGWQMHDAQILDRDWGFGLPFAVRVAEMHDGRLYHIADTQRKGCVLCMSLPAQDDPAIETPVFYVESALDLVEIELSVLG